MLLSYSLYIDQTTLTQYQVTLLTNKGLEFNYYVFSAPLTQSEVEQIAMDMCDEDFIEDDNDDRAASVIEFIQYGVIDNPELDNEEEINYFMRKRYGEEVTVNMEKVNFNSWDHDFLQDYTGPQTQQ